MLSIANFFEQDLQRYLFKKNTSFKSRERQKLASIVPNKAWRRHV